MWFFSKKNITLDIIRCDDPSYIIWKWRSSNTYNNRENSIRFGSSLRVKSGEVAIFIHHHENNLIQEEIQGPFDKILETDNLPGIADIIEKLYVGKSPFQAEIYFINLSPMQMKFGVPYFSVYDYRNPNLHVPVSVRGSMNFKIDNYSEFIKIHSFMNITIEELQDKIRSTINKCVINTISDVSLKIKVSVSQLERQISLISEMLLEEMSKKILELYGIHITNVDINSIEIDKTSNEYVKFKNYENNQQ